MVVDVISAQLTIGPADGGSVEPLSIVGPAGRLAHGGGCRDVDRLAGWCFGRCCALSWPTTLHYTTLHFTTTAVLLLFTSLLWAPSVDRRHDDDCVLCSSHCPSPFAPALISRCSATAALTTLAVISRLIVPDGARARAPLHRPMREAPPRAVRK